MPRKKTMQPEPLDRFYLEDGSEVVLIDETCWPIGRGQHHSKKFEVRVQAQILEKLGADLYGEVTSDMSEYDREEFMRGNRFEAARNYMKSPKKFVDQLTSWGILGADAEDLTHVRKYWYPKIKIMYNSLIGSMAANPGHKIKVRLLPKNRSKNEIS